MATAAPAAERPTFTRDEWLAEAKRRFGPDAMTWRFKCSLCGNVQSPADFQALGADPQRAYVECIGRVLLAQGKIEASKLGGLKPGRAGADAMPCDWAVFGLLGPLNGGTKVITDADTHMWVFDFAGEDKPE